MKRYLPLIIVSVIVFGLAYIIYTFNQPKNNTPIQVPVDDIKNTVIFPVQGDILVKGFPYHLEWEIIDAPKESIAIFLIDASLEQQGESVSISDRVYDIPNIGTYDYSIPTNLPEGTYKLRIGKMDSGYFRVLSLRDAISDCMPKSDIKSKTQCDELISMIDDYEKCTQAGFPVIESYPQQCRTPDGRTFTQDITADN